MRSLGLVGAVAIAALLGTPAAACNARGEFCGYPLWAANAFSNPRDRINEAAVRKPDYRPSYDRDIYRKRVHASAGRKIER
jgi:hypothetical protein